MSVEFNNSRTKENLMRAFAGESQARNRYTFAASKAKQLKLHVIESIFTFTANQEKEHAEIFYKHLKDLSGGNISVDGSYPVDMYDDVLSLLKAAKHNEYEEYNDVYKTFGDIAKEEGFEDIASSFHMIAEIEKTHGDRFGRYADKIEQNKLFSQNEESMWLCLNCGHIHTGKEAPQNCPVCDHNQGYFILLDEAPYHS
ncbi:rubrerythrin [Anaerovorax odorimutans]|uniref:rubrerythrin n=1 Tax=Anaerovorax odorimutans TaxID=109327 RepID=UPI00041FFE33|nr:rubrerythrin family protein [Anaerovorax odorimutans]